MRALQYRRIADETQYIGMLDAEWTILAINPIIEGILKRGTVHTDVDMNSIHEIEISAPIDGATGEILN